MRVEPVNLYPPAAKHQSGALGSNGAEDIFECMTKACSGQKMGACAHVRSWRQSVRWAFLVGHSYRDGKAREEPWDQGEELRAVFQSVLCLGQSRDLFLFRKENPGEVEERKQLRPVGSGEWKGLGDSLWRGRSQWNCQLTDFGKCTEVGTRENGPARLEVMEGEENPGCYPVSESVIQE